MISFSRIPLGASVARWLTKWCTALLALSAPSQASEKPNILLCFADDWGRHASAYAKLDGPGGVNDLVKTPNFDRIAAEGVLFRKAFVSSPSCTPCRSALVSGQHFWRTGRGSILRGAVWDGSQPSYPLLLREAGYHIGKMYKVWGPGTPNDAPYDGQKAAFQKAGGRFNQFSQNVTQMVAAGQALDAAKKELYDEVLANFESFLSARKPGQPFCFWFGPTNVHRQWTKGSGKALWGLNPDDLKGKMPPFLPDVPEVREDLADYLGEAMAFDAALGVLLKKLEDIGELDRTLVVVSGDHGAPGFPHGKCNLYDFGSSVSLAIRGAGTKGGRVIDDLTSLTDLAPTFLELAGVKVPPAMTGRSLLPLLQSEKGGQVDPARTAVFLGRERHVENAREGFLPYPQRAIRTHDYLFIRNFKPDRWPLGEPYRLDGNNPPSAEEIAKNTRVTLPDEDAGPTKAWLIGMRNDPKWKAHYEWVYGRREAAELYDLKSDPHQTKNVANDPAYAQTKAELEQRLMDELKRTGDPRVVDDGKFFETPPMAGPTGDGKDREGGDTPPEQLRNETGAQTLPTAPSSAAEKPNIIVIMADDLGYGDVSCNGAKAIETPGIDRLAREGVRFTSGYCSASTCTPSRWSLLTGTYAFRQKGTGIAPPNGPLLVKPGTETLPGMLKKAGYKTAVIGKWHLGLGHPAPDWNGELKPGPLEIGFDHCFLLPTTNDRVPQVFVENWRVRNLDPADPLWVGDQKPSGDHPTGLTHRETLKLDWSHGHNQTIHNGISRIGFYTGGTAARFRDEDVADEWIKQCNRWIDANKDRPFFLFFASQDIHVPRIAHERFQGKTSMGPRGDCILQFDWCVGEILNTLDRLKLAEKTLVILCSDNGPVLDDGYKDDAVVKLGDHKPAGPFRGGKYSVWEGGTRTPFLTRWLGRVKPTVSEEVVCTIDLAASFAALTGQAVPETAFLDSQNVLPALLGESKAKGRQYLIQQSNDGTNLGLRAGEWKLVRLKQRGKNQATISKDEKAEPKRDFSLYHLPTDPGEETDVSEKHPEVLGRLQAEMEKIIAAGRSR